MSTKANRSTISVGHLTRVGVLSALAAILFLWPEIPIFPPVYKLDFSNLPALLAGFSMGPWYGLVVVAIKSISGMMHSSSGFVGELADFLMSGAFVVVASFVYARNRSFKGAIIGMLLGIVAMVVASALSNYYILIPFYLGEGLTEEKLFGMMQAFVPAVDSMGKLIALITIPFNLIKGVAISLITTLIYKRLSRLLHVSG